jgi:hypothetical protein
MPSMVVFRVCFTGPELSDEAKDALDDVEGRWEGTAQVESPTQDHRVLVGAPTSDDAIVIVQRSLRTHGAFSGFTATPVRNHRGEVQGTPIRTSSWEIDWDEVEANAKLTELHRTLVESIVDAAEPTWILLKDPNIAADGETVEAALRDLEERGLVRSTWEPSGDAEFGALETWRGERLRMCKWWALTDAGWELFGLIKSPGYR